MTEHNHESENLPKSVTTDNEPTQHDETVTDQEASEHQAKSADEEALLNNDINSQNKSQSDQANANKTDSDSQQAQHAHYQRNPSKVDKSAGLKKVLLGLFIVLVLGAIAYGLYESTQNSAPETITLQGQMQMQQTSIAAKVPGRIANILVTEGDQVTAGQQLIEMDSPEINAKIDQARAGQQMAQSQFDKAENGARPQEIAQAKAAWQANKAASDLAESTYTRVNRLYEEGLMSRQKRDEAYTQYLANADKTEAARLQYDLALEGARSEDKDAASAQVAQVDAKLEEALIAQEEANLKSPIAGVVDSVIVNPGEVIGQGVPLLTLVNTNDQWVVINVTETHLNQFNIGDQFTGTIPALSSANAPYTKQFTVYATSTLSDFATWRPTNNDDGFDIRTFEVKARPSTPDARIRSGMSVIVHIDASATSSEKQ